MSIRCEAQVWDANGWHRFRCSRMAKRRVGDKAYCTQHARIEERQAKLRERSA
jgi:hypothetical protein